MSELPVLQTARTVMLLLPPERAPLLQAYRAENRDHLAPWEPARAPDWFGAASARAHLEQSLAQARGVFQACHLGFSVAAGRQGSGLMHEVAAAGIAHMFGHEGLHRIMASHLPHNTRSAALLRRLGFEREGLARSYLRINGRWEDMVLNSLINPADCEIS